MRPDLIRNAIEARARMMQRYPEKYTDEDRAWLASPAVAAVRAGGPVSALSFATRGEPTEEELKALEKHLKEST